MANFCELSGKGPISGHSVSHSNVKTKRKFLPNLQKKSFYIPVIRTINKKGIYVYLKELEKKGEISLGF